MPYLLGIQQLLCEDYTQTLVWLCYRALSSENNVVMKVLTPGTSGSVTTQAVSCIH